MKKLYIKALKLDTSQCAYSMSAVALRHGRERWVCHVQTRLNAAKEQLGKLLQDDGQNRHGLGEGRNEALIRKAKRCGFVAKLGPDIHSDPRLICLTQNCDEH